jgi:hypothetical protein
MAKRVRTADMTDNSIGSSQLIDETIVIDDLKTQTDLDSINAQSIPFERTSPTPTIWDVVNPLTANTFTLSQDLFTATGLSDTFTLSGTVDTTAIYYVVVNGQFQDEAKDFALITADTEVKFNYVPEVGMNLRVYYKPA